MVTIDLPIWGIFVLIAVGASIILMLSRLKRKGVEGVMIQSFLVWIVLGALLGGRIAFILLFPNYASWESTFSWYEIAYAGRLHIVGGYFGAALVAYVFVNIINILDSFKVSIVQFFDLVLYSLPIGMSIGYVGVFLSQVYGILSPSASSYSALYLSIGYLLLAMILEIVYNRYYQMKLSGYTTSIAILGVCLIHFVVDIWVNPLYVEPRFAGLTITQCIALSVAIITSMVILFKREYNRGMKDARSMVK